MAENAYQVTSNGQEVQQSDIGQLGTTGGLADDHLLAELLRMPPYVGTTYAKSVLPYNSRNGGNFGCVTPSGRNDGSIWVFPFRAIVGSRNAYNAAPANLSTDSAALANWRDIRSGVYVGSNSVLATPIVIASNSSGNPRWDLVYCSIAPDASGPSVNRRVKDPSSGQITVVSVPSYLYSPVTVTVITGTPGATPALPTLPADGAGQYNIPLAYVRVPNGFSSTTTIATQDIRSTTKNGVAEFAHVQGGFKAKPCNGNNDENSNFNAGGNFAWTSTSGARPGPWLPPDMVGGSVFLAQIDDSNHSSPSHASLAIVDSSIDWRNRFFKVTGVYNSVRAFAADPAHWSGAVAAVPTPEAGQISATSVNLGSSFNPLGDGVSSSGYNTVWTATVSGQQVALMVNTSDGTLRWYIAGSTSSRYWFWIEVTSQLNNA